jgi:hypothetical protein
MRRGRALSLAQRAKELYAVTTIAYFRLIIPSCLGLARVGLALLAYALGSFSTALVTPRYGV